MLRAILCAGLVVGALGGSALADPVVNRQAAMSHVGAAAKASGAMLKGEVDYDAAKALLALRIMNATALGFGSQFPEGSETGAETEAAPAIWSDRAGFDAAADKFIADTKAAIDAAPADLEAFKAAFGGVAANCKACHKDYRIKKN